MSGVTNWQLQQIEQSIRGAHAELRALLDSADFHVWRGADADRWRAAFESEVLTPIASAANIAGSLSVEPY